MNQTAWNLSRLKDRIISPFGGALVGAGLAFIVLLIIGWQAGQWYQERAVADLRAQASVETSLRANAISAAIFRRFALMEGLHAFIEAESHMLDFAEKLEIFSAGIYTSTPGIRNIAVAPGGAMRYVYPLEGNEAVIGYDPLQDPRPQVRADVQRAIDSGTIVLSGPNDLIQGGRGLIARQAVYLDGVYWGLLSLVVDLQPILERANLVDPSGENEIALRDSYGALIHGPAQVFAGDPVLYRIELPEGYWEMASLPPGGWQAAVRDQVRLFQLGELTLILLFSGLVYLTLNRQSSLRQLVAARTKEISLINEQLLADIGERKRVEASLRASEERQANLLDVAPDAIIAIDERQRIVMFNKAAESMFGYQAKEVLQRPLSMLLPERFAALHEQHVRAFMAEPVAMRRMDGRTQIWGRRKDGSEFPAEAGLSKLAEAGKTTLTAIVRDVTRRKQMEAELREREEQYRNIFTSVNDALFITDPDTGQVVDFNPAASRMHGYTDEEFRQLEVGGFVHPDSQHLFQEYLQAVKAGGVFRARAVDVRKDGSTLPIEVLGLSINYAGKPHILGVVRDVTEEVQAYQMLEERVAQRTHELQTLLEVSRNVSSTLDLNTLLSLILEQLKTVVDFTSLTVWMQTVAGKFELIEYQGPLQPEKALQRWKGSPKSAIDLVHQREPLIIPDVRAHTPMADAWREAVVAMLGEVPPYVRSWMFIPLLVNDRKIGHLNFHHEQPGYYTPRHAELALAVANHAAIAIENARLYEEAQHLAALQERQKLARELHDSVSQALYGIALGARTARTLLDRDPAQAVGPLDYCLALAEAGLAEMRALIFELRPESLESEGLAAALMKQVAAIRARYSIEVEADLCPEPDIPLASKEALYRVAQEAMHNTVKHASATRIRLAMRCADGLLSLEVNDDGAGFDPDAEYPGHLGLKSMRERAERLGGGLQIESAPGQGARLRVWAPLGDPSLSYS